MVADLIKEDGMSWDSAKLTQFNRRDVDLILNIQLSIQNVEDAICWWPKKFGHYKAKDAYLLLTNQDLQGNIHEIAEVWRKLWKVNIAPRVKETLWRALSQCLLTKTRLSNKHILEDTTCCLCLENVEMDIHLYWDCNYA